MSDSPELIKLNEEKIKLLIALASLRLDYKTMESKLVDMIFTLEKKIIELEGKPDDNHSNNA